MDKVYKEGDVGACHLDVWLCVVADPVQYHILLPQGVEDGISLCQLVVDVEETLQGLLPTIS